MKCLYFNLNSIKKVLKLKLNKLKTTNVLSNIKEPCISIPIMLIIR